MRACVCMCVCLSALQHNQDNLQSLDPSYALNLSSFCWLTAAPCFCSTIGKCLLCVHQYAGAPHNVCWLNSYFQCYKIFSITKGKNIRNSAKIHQQKEGLPALDATPKCMQTPKSWSTPGKKGFFL